MILFSNKSTSFPPFLALYMVSSHNSQYAACFYTASTLFAFTVIIALTLWNKTNPLCNSFLLKCIFSRTNIFRSQRQPGADWETVPAVQLQHVAVRGPQTWRAIDGGGGRRSVWCRPWPQKQVGAVTALRGWQFTQLFFSWSELKFMCVHVRVLSCTATHWHLLLWTLCSLSPPLQNVWCVVLVRWPVFWLLTSPPGF